MTENNLAKLFRMLNRVPLGQRLFSQIVCWKAPYFGSVRPVLTELRAGYCAAYIRKRRAVTNHLGTIHAIAACNLCELVAGLLMEASIPSHLRWIPVGMQVEYLKKCPTDMHATCELAEIAWQPDTQVPLTVTTFNQDGEPVVSAVISMHVSAKPAKPKHG